jgi:hypothetical protein
MGPKSLLRATVSEGPEEGVGTQGTHWWKGWLPLGLSCCVV